MRPSPERLAKLPLFASLAADQLQGLAGFATLRQEPAGARIVEEGVPGFAMFVVEEGTALVRSGGVELARLGPGDFFGEIAVLGEGWRTATVTALSPLTVVVMVGRDFRMFERELPDVHERLHEVMAERLERSAALHAS